MTVTRRSSAAGRVEEGRQRAGDEEPAPDDSLGEAFHDAEEEAHTSPEGSAEGSSSGEEEYVVEEEEAAALWSGSDGEEDVYGLTSDPSAAADAYRSQLARFPLLRDFVPPAMQHELAAELSMRSAAASSRGMPHPLARGPSANSLGAGGSGGGDTGGSSGGAVTDARSPSRRHPPPASGSLGAGEARHAGPQSRRRLNPAHALLLREARQGSGGGCMLPEQCAHFAAFHRLPSTPTRVVDRRTSRGYIGQFTADGNIFIAAFQHERKIRLYEVHYGWRLVKDIHARGLQWTVTDTALSSDNRFLLYSSITPEVHLVTIGGSGGVESVANVTDIHETLDFLSGQRQQRLGIWSIQWSADSREIVAGTSDPGLRIFDMMQFKTVASAGGHEDDVNAVAYAERDSPNLIFSGSDDTFVKVWDRRTLDASGRRSRPAGVFVGHTEGVTHLDSKGDGRYVISNSKDQSIKLWDTRMMAGEKEARRLSRDAPSFHWDYRWMDFPGRGRVVQHPHCAAVQTYRGHTVLSTLIRSYWSPAATTGQRYIYTGSFDGRVHVYDAITAQAVAKLGGYHRECVRDCSWHPYLPLLATVSFDGSVTTWEPEVPGEAEAAREEAAAAADAAHPGSGRRVAKGGRQRHLPAPMGDQHAW